MKYRRSVSTLTNRHFIFHHYFLLRSALYYFVRSENKCNIRQVRRSPAGRASEHGKMFSVLAIAFSITEKYGLSLFSVLLVE